MILQVAESFFIEATTGHRYTLDGSPYNGIEFVWNHENYWACMQMPQPHSDSRADPATIKFDFLDTIAWEPLLDLGQPVSFAAELHVPAASPGIQIAFRLMLAGEQPGGTGSRQ